MKNILLTGSGGFIGKNLKEYLQEKYNLYTPRSYELNLIDSLAVEDYFKKYDIDFIIHCSSVGGYRTQQDKDTTVEDNLAMVENLLKYKKENCRVILFGSGAMYNKARDLKKVKEEEIGKFIPDDLYGKSKLMISDLVKGKKDVLCLNIFGCYGKYEKESRFPTYAIKQNLQHLPIEINRNVVFDYLYIEDLCEIIKHFIENEFPENNILNVTPDESISLKELAEIVNETGNYVCDIIIKDERMNFEYTGSNNRLKQVYPKIKFKSYYEGLKEMYEFIKENSEVKV